MTPRSRLARLAVIGVTAAIVVACGSPPAPTAVPLPSPTAVPSTSPGASVTPVPSVDQAAILGAINEQVRAIRGLEEKAPVETAFVTDAEFDEVLRRLIQEDVPPDLLAAYDDLYHAMGLMDADDSLAEVFVQLLQESAAGLYVPEDEKLYVLSDGDGIGAVEKVYYAHEYDHALQDQAYDLEAFQPEDLVDETDLQLARQSLVEGDAYVLMTQWLQQNLTPEELGEVVASGGDTSGLEGIPPIVLAAQLFPALYGWTWATAVHATGGWAAIDAAWADPPTTTEQILHLEKWASREPAIDVTLPDDLAARLGTGWEESLADTFGEYNLGVWITGEAAVALPTPPPASVIGWGGDRVAMYQGPDDAWVVVGRTEWDSPDDAAEFETALAPRLQDAAGPAQVLPGEGGTVRWFVIGSDDAALAKAANVLGLAG